MPPPRRKLGVPYAPLAVDVNGRFYRECPICGARIYERVDATGETVTNYYGEHCERDHPGH